MTSIPLSERFGPYCMSSAQGATLYHDLRSSLGRNEAVELDFTGVSILIASFLNASLAKMYGEFSQEEIVALVSFRGLSPAHAEVVQAVVDNAKSFFYNETYRKAQDEAIKKMFE